MGRQTTTYCERELAQVALPTQLLAKLISNGVIHGNECQSLNTVAKRVIWQSLLTSCVSINRQ